MISTHAFEYENFCTDISNYLKKHEVSFIETSFDGLSSYVNKDQLAVVLSNFWFELNGSRFNHD